MTIEIQRTGSPFVYQIDADDPRLINRRVNRHNARWHFYLRRETAREAKAALMAIGRGEKGGAA